MFKAIVCRRLKWAALPGAACVLAGLGGTAVLAAEQLASGPPVQAKDLVGLWQGPQGGAFKMTKRADGKLHGELYFGGPEPSGFTRNGNPISSIKIEGRKVRMELDEMFGTIEGNLSADGQTWAGTFTASFGAGPFIWKRMTETTIAPIDPSPHKVLFVPVEKDVQLEVLDWGGTGPALVFLAGNGNTAHVFDDFAPKFTAKHHVYGITRRGFGLSSKPTPTEENYDPDRLGDDVLAVIAALKLNHPVLAGHSLAGEEMSSIGTRHPEKVAGLVYLDASYSYAFYNPRVGGMDADIATMHRDLFKLLSATPSQSKTLIQEMQATIPLLRTNLDNVLKLENGRPDVPPPARRTLRDKLEDAIFISIRKYQAVKDPILAIVAVPHACGTNCDAPDVKAREADVATQTDAFEAATPSARVVRIAHADHYVFRSNEAEVFREMNAFMDGLH
jgi:non-heme chloroperoxidase